MLTRVNGNTRGVPPVKAPYGSWRSPIDGDAVARTHRWRYSMVTAAGGALLWSEARPHEDGRLVVVRRRPDEDPVDLTPAGFNVRTRVHEYGGGAFATHAGVVLFSNFDDQRLYRQDGEGAEPRAITPEPEVPAGARYADGRVTPDGALLVCVRERHAEPEHVDELVAVPTDGSTAPRVLAAGHDFYAAPRVSPDGGRLAWLAWDHPRMPWDGTELWVAGLRDDGTLDAPALVAGGPEESVLQPEWSPDGVLHFLSDRTGWWNLYRGDGEALAPMNADLGGPLWMLGRSWYGFLYGGGIACTYVAEGRDRLAIVHAPGRAEPLDVEWTTIAHLATDGANVYFAGSAPARAAQVIRLDPATGAATPLSGSSGEDLDPRYVSEPRPVAFPTADGDTAHALFYAPRNPDFSGPPTERPPLVVHVHGGPTGHVTPDLEPWVQYFTSRGYAVADVNYRGSTGYGRAYRERLRGRWGVVDVEDAVAAALHLAWRGDVDAGRMAITGGSAGGWTVLCALAHHDVFAAGTDAFGVADLVPFNATTHKFESRYVEGLVGRDEGLLRERSPVTHADRIRAPVLVLQGLEDAVVPPSQSEAVVAALARNGVPHAYIAFPGEQHGFRRAETIRRAIEAELSFYGQIFGVAPADDVERVALAC